MTIDPKFPLVGNEHTPEFVANLVVMMESEKYVRHSSGQLPGKPSERDIFINRSTERADNKIEMLINKTLTQYGNRAQITSDLGTTTLRYGDNHIVTISNGDLWGVFFRQYSEYTKPYTVLNDWHKSCEN